MANTTFFNGGAGDSRKNKVIATGTGAANTKATQYMVEDVDRFVTPRGHGFAAEKMNHYWDKAYGHDALTEEQADVRLR